MKDKNKSIVLVSGIVVILLMVAGISFAIFRFGEESTNQELVLGDIWMKYTESNGISLENALPGDEYTNYFEFTITGTNTYTKKDVFYDLVLTHGDTPAGKTEDNRIEDKYLKFKLTEVNGNTETEIFTDKTYDNLTSKRVHVDTISKSTSTYSKTYRLYMVISEELTYGNSSDAILTTEEFGKIFGSIKVNVTGDFNEKSLYSYNDCFRTVLLPDGTLEINGYYQYDEYYKNQTMENPLCTSDVIIPSEIDGKRVTSIGYGAFSTLYVTSVIIPDTVKKIGASAFRNGENNAIEMDVYVGSGVEYIGGGAFVSKWQNIYFPTKTCNEIANIPKSETDSTTGVPFYDGGYFVYEVYIYGINDEECFHEGTGIGGGVFEE